VELKPAADVHPAGYVGVGAGVGVGIGVGVTPLQGSPLAELYPEFERQPSGKAGFEIPEPLHAKPVVEL